MAAEGQARQVSEIDASFAAQGFAMTVAIVYIDVNTWDDAKQRGDSDRDVIMGAAANYDQDVLVPYVESLLRCGFQGDKVTYEKKA